MPDSTPVSNPWRLAWAGDPQAIAQLLNRSLQARGIEAIVTSQAHCLRLTLRSPQPLHRDKVVAWLQTGLAKLNPAQFQRIEVVAWRSHAPAPDWQQEVKVAAPVPVGERIHSAAAAAPAVNLERLANAISVNIQAGDITGQVVVGNKNIVVGPGGHLVVNRLAAQPRPQIKPIAAKDRLQPPPMPHLLDRTEESQTIIAALGQRQSVECFSDRGFGKTALLCAIAHRPEVIPYFSAGVPYLSARRLPLEDLWQALFDAFYTTDLPCKPTLTQIRHCLKGKSALVVIDDVALDDDDMQALLYHFPDQTFLFATHQQQIWGAEAKAIPLAGLPLPDAIALVEQTLGRALSNRERQAAETLCRHLEGHPLRILQAIAQVKQRAVAIADVVQQVLAASSPEQATLAELEQLPTPAKRVLAVLALLAGIPLQAATLADLSGTPEVAPALADLQAWHWVIGDGQGFHLAENLLTPLQPWVAIQDWLPHLATTVSRWLQLGQIDAAGLASQADPILQVMTLAAQSDQWATVLELGRGLETALILNGQWGRWEESLQMQLQTALALGDRATEAFVLHQLGSRSLALGDVLTAHHYLTEALALRDTLADPSGVEWTEHNLALLYSAAALEPDPPLDPLTTLPSPSPGQRFPRRWAAIAAGVGAIGMVGAIGWALWPRPVEIEASPSELLFPATPINTPVTQALTLRNPGYQALGLSQPDFTLLGAAQADYQILANTCVEAAPLPPGDDCTVLVQFLPQVEGDRPAQLRIQLAPNQHRDIPLQGRALPEDLSPELTTSLGVSSTVLTFDRQELGTPSSAQTLTLTNDGDTDVTLTPATLTLAGQHPQDFAVVLDAACPDQTNEDNTITLAPGDRCDLPITFQPQAGGDRTATLTLADLASPLQVSLVGTGMTVPRLTLRQSPQPFGPTPMGQNSPAQPVQILSSGTGPLTITAVTLSDQPAPAFRLGEQTCTNSSLDPQGTCSVSVLFAPGTVGSHQAQLEIQSNAADSPHRIPLSGEGQPRATPLSRPTPTTPPEPIPSRPDPTPELTPTPDPISTARLVATPNIVDFEYGTSDKNPQSLRLAHQGDGSLTIERIILTGEDADRFVLSHQCEGQVFNSSGEFCLVEIQFQPGGPNTRVSAQIEVYASSTSEPLIIQLRGSVLI